MLVSRKSPYRGVKYQMQIDVTEKQIALWEGGALIQDVMPNLTPEEREFIMTGITPAEWNEMFAQSDVGPNNNGVIR